MKKLKFYTDQVLKNKSRTTNIQNKQPRNQSEKRNQYLGIILDSQLTFKSHFKYLVHETQKITQLLKRICPKKYGYDNKSSKTMIN